MHYCCLPTFAMMGALAWQVTIPNKVTIFVFGGEMARGFCPALLSGVLSLASLLCSLESSARSTRINVSQNLALCYSELLGTMV